MAAFTGGTYVSFVSCYMEYDSTVAGTRPREICPWTDPEGPRIGKVVKQERCITPLSGYPLSDLAYWKHNL